MKLIPETVVYLNSLLENNPVPENVAENIREIIAANEKTNIVAQTANIDYLKYLHPHEELLSVSATTGSYNEKKWKKFFHSGIQNHTGENWDVITSCCDGTPPGKVQANDLIKDGKYSQFIKDEKQNFHAGIEAAFKVVEDNPALVEEVLKEGKSLHIPFTNTQGDRFVVYVFKCRGMLHANVNKHSSESFWCFQYGYVVLYPQQHLNN